jgi:threonine synthase
VSTTKKTRLWCGGCRHDVGPVDQYPFPFRCSRAVPGDDIDHVVRRTLHVSTWRTVTPPDEDETFVQSWLGSNGGWRHAMDAHSPFLKYRQRLYSYHLGRAHGLPETEFAAIVGDLDEKIETIEGAGFRPTPFARAPLLARDAGLGGQGEIWVKDETGNVSGSHKARHLFGVMVYLRVIEALLQRGLFPEDAPGVAHVVAATAEPLAIASCGNAALAAAIVARAAERSLEVYIPTWANRGVVDDLQRHGAEIRVCERRPGERGDPCYLRFKENIAAGAIPFCCQGPENGLAIEGGQTLMYEMLDALDAQPMDRLFVQVGGGALASACVRALEEALAAGAIERLPRIHAVQTEGVAPLARAWDRVALDVLRRAGTPLVGADAAIRAEDRPMVAAAIAGHADRRAIFDAIREAATHRSRYMWPWEEVSHSRAEGILDDETYDWLAVVEGMLLSGGWPVLVNEEDVERANHLAHWSTGIDVCHTGSAGLAGLLALQRQGRGGEETARVGDERIGLVFTGVSRR